MLIIAADGRCHSAPDVPTHDIFFGDFAFAVVEQAGITHIVVAQVPCIPATEALKQQIATLQPPYQLSTARHSPRAFRLWERLEDAASLLRRVREVTALPKFLYHGTTMDRLEAIAGEGLRHDTGNGEEWRGCEPDLVEWSAGKVFLSTSEENAMVYAEQKAGIKGDHPVVLRVKPHKKWRLQNDGMGLGSGEVFLEQSIPARGMEIRIDDVWSPIYEQKAEVSAELNVNSPKM